MKHLQLRGEEEWDVKDLVFVKHGIKFTRVWMNSLSGDLFYLKCFAPFENIKYIEYESKKS